MNKPKPDRELWSARGYTAEFKAAGAQKWVATLRHSQRGLLFSIHEDDRLSAAAAFETLKRGIAAGWLGEIDLP